MKDYIKYCIYCIFIALIYYFFIQYICISYFPYVLSIIIVYSIISFLKTKFYYNQYIGMIFLFLLYFLFSFLFLIIIYYIISFVYHSLLNYQDFYNYLISIINSPVILKLFQYYQSYYEEIMKFIINKCIYFMSIIPITLKNYLIMIISSFMLLISYDHLKQICIKYVDKHILISLLSILTSLINTFKIYVLTQLKLMIIVFIYLIVGFTILKIPHVLLCSLLLSLLDALPFIGVGIALIPMSIIEIMIGHYLKAIYIIILYLLIYLTRTFLEPVFMKNEFKVPIFILFISMIIHIRLFGFIGVVISPLTLTIIHFYLDNYHSFSKIE